jgi:hypothetical protein
MRLIHLLALLLLTTYLTTPSLYAEEPSSPPPASAVEPAPAPRVITEYHNPVLMLGPRFDAGKGAFSYGLGALYGREEGSHSGGLGVAAWMGVGGELRLLTRAHEALDAVEAYATGHVGFVGDVGGAALELGLGGAAAMEGEAYAAGYAGLFWGLYFFDLGYVVRFPLGPFRYRDEMPLHNMAIRINVPVWSGEVHEETRPLPDP